MRCVSVCVCVWARVWIFSGVRAIYAASNVDMYTIFVGIARRLSSLFFAHCLSLSNLHFKCMIAMHMPHIYLFIQNVSTQIKPTREKRPTSAPAFSRLTSVHPSPEILTAIEGEQILFSPFAACLYAFYAKSLQNSIHWHRLSLSPLPSVSPSVCFFR